MILSAHRKLLVWQKSQRQDGFRAQNPTIEAYPMVLAGVAVHRAIWERFTTPDVSKLLRRMVIEKRLCFGYQNASKDFGGVDKEQLYVIDPVFSIDYGWLGATFLSHYWLRVKRFLT